MEYRVLGPVEVLADGRPVAIGGPKPRSLVVLLLLNAGRVVPTSQVIEALWGGRPPMSGATRVQGVVSQLRAAFARAGVTGGPIVTRPPGYLLTVGDGELDLEVFERRCGDGRADAARGELEAAAAAYRAGLELWRGPALTGVDAVFAQAEAARLEERRLAAVEDLTEVELALGGHAGLVGELGALVARHPLRERLRERLMLALYRSGRQAEALEVYREGRRLLVEELGLEPGPDLQRLQRAILTGDPDLDPPAAATGGVRVAAPEPVPRQLPRDVASFTGREPELVQLDRALAAAGRDGPVVISAIEGTGGIGKSALAVHAAHRLAGRFPDGQLYVDLHGATAGLQPLAPLEVLGRFLRTLGAEPAAVPADLEEASAAFRSRVAGRRLLVVLDNAVDAAQVRPLLPAAAGCGVLVTSRQLLASLDGAPTCTWTSCPHGTRPSCSAVWPASSGWRPSRRRPPRWPAAAGTCRWRCGSRGPGWRRGRAGRWRRWRSGWPTRSAAWTSWRSPRRACGRATTSPTSSSRPARRPWTGRRRRSGCLACWTVRSWACRSRRGCWSLLRRRPSGSWSAWWTRNCWRPPAPGRYRLHDLLRLYAREQAARQRTAPERAAALGRVLGLYAATAWHTLALLRPGDLRLARADDRWTTGGLELTDAATALGWLDAERANLLAAVRQAATTPGVPAEMAVQLAHALFAFFEVRSHSQDWVQVNQTALGIARRLGDRAAQAQAHNDLGLGHSRHGRFREALACHQQSLAIRRELGDQPGQAASLVNLGNLHELQGHHDQALTFLEESLDLYRELGDQRGQAASLGNLGYIHERQGRYQEALACHQASLGIYRELGDPSGQAETLRDFGIIHQRQGRHDQALACLRESLDLYRQLGAPYGQAESLRELGMVLRTLGRPEEARTHWRRALATFEQLQTTDVDQVRALLDEQITLRQS